ncbi:MAG: GTP cyclohydrolase I [Leucobacter sp.]
MNAGVDRERIVLAVRELLSAIGADPDSAELSATPGRVADSYAEFFAGMGVDPVELLSDALPLDEDTGELVLLRDISLRSVCEHHLLPFRGRAHIAYQPGGRVVGLSTLPRVVAALAARPQVQERLGEQIVQALEDGLAPRGALVVLEASHGCVTDRGVREVDVTAVTIASRGSLSEPVARAEVMALIASGQERPEL